MSRFPDFASLAFDAPAAAATPVSTPAWETPEGIGGPELMMIMFVILLLFGGKKIPELMRGLGSGVKEFKKATNVEEEQEARRNYDRLDERRESDRRLEDRREFDRPVDDRFREEQRSREAR